MEDEHKCFRRLFEMTVAAMLKHHFWSSIVFQHSAERRLG